MIDHMEGSENFTDLRHTLLYQSIKMCRADNEYHRDEKAAVNKAAQILGVKPDVVTQLESVAESQTESVAEFQPEAVAESQMESVVESQPESVAESQIESVAESQPESVEELQPETIPESQPEAVEPNILEKNILSIKITLLQFGVIEHFP